MNRQPVNKNGQSLIETIIALGIAVFIIVALTQSVIMSVKNTQFAKNQTLATRYGQEAIEKIRNVRDLLGWPTFYNNYNGTTKCINSGEYTNWSDSVPCEINIGDIFIRQATFEGDTDQLTITVTTSWTDTTGDHNSEQVTILTRWQ